jgi:cell wall assembly regulator SMI1
MRIASLVAASALSVAAVLTAAPPAQAAPAGPPPLCFTEYDLLTFPGSVRAYAYRSCDDEPPTGLAVSLQRFDPASGVWRTVAQGIGEARFSCFGTGQRVYRNAKQTSLKVTVNCT